MPYGDRRGVGRLHRRGRRRPALAIEVPHRITKPALFAAAGIPCYWRIETDGGIVVHTYRLDHTAEVYQPTGTCTDVLRTDEPWPVEVPIARLRPRHL